ncbi:MAG: hypothetical protein JWM28_1872 [Chitinophagaceae bacterium]|nr:hypothetical protein [Chitinophagaceae bacterium]
MSQTSNGSGANFDALFNNHKDSEHAFHMTFGKRQESVPYRKLRNNDSFILVTNVLDLVIMTG